ncbi:hypothetical protein [Kosakonia cowanii]|uniref:hypothetical protein n=1 Tax=Kosakonia cowanii TaxID=208223 RepID=UPI002899391E|nr:hypothetical protein [Kosakonia cowanii]
MIPQRISYFSGFPVLMMPNAPSKLKNASLTGAPQSFVTRRGDCVHANGLTRDYHLYIMASRINISFSSNVVWDPVGKKVVCDIVFHTFPNVTMVGAEILLDGSSPYPLPPMLDVTKIQTVRPVQYTNHGYLVGLEIICINNTTHNYFLNPDLLHYLRFINPPAHLTDFHVEYIGIACGPNGTRDVFKRATAHEKSVEIQADLIQKNGNRALYIFAYDPGYIIESKTGAPSVITTTDVISSLIKGGENSLYEVMEASLIAHFQPHYNIEFKQFPSNEPQWLKKDMQSLNGCVLDVNEIAVTLLSDCSLHSKPWIFGNLTSSKISAQTFHTVQVSV